MHFFGNSCSTQAKVATQTPCRWITNADATADGLLELIAALCSIRTCSWRDAHSNCASPGQCPKQAATARPWNLTKDKQQQGCETVGKASHELLLPLLSLEDESSSEEDESSDPLALAAAACWAAAILGISARSALILSVSPPSPMDVKKLMLKRMLRAMSCQKTD